MDNVWVTVEDVPEIAGLLGLYTGVPLTDRESYGGMVMPDRITLYRIPICAMCRTEEEVVEAVKDTVIHEVAHHFGIDDDRLDELGWARGPSGPTERGARGPSGPTERGARGPSGPTERGALGCFSSRTPPAWGTRP